MKKSFTEKLWKLMKIGTVQIIMSITLCGVSLAHPNFAQLLDKEIDLDLQKVSLEQALKQIEQLADVKFAYSTALLEDQAPVSIQLKNMSLRGVLDSLLTPRQIQYNVHEKEASITLKKVNEDDKNNNKKDQGSNQRRSRDELQVTGTVLDGSTNQPLPGVNIIVKGTTLGTTSDSDGHYSLLVDGNATLVFSFIGYASLEEMVNSRSVINVALMEDIASLNDVEINAGYWKVREQERTGNIARVSAEEIQKQPVTNPLTALAGRMPGVYVQQYSGLPGGGINIFIRGANSLRPDGNYPLYIVDGVPFTSTSLSSTNVGGEILPGANPLNNINPNDIESIEILKDADATAIYGSRGANGVVLITTKKGKAGKTKLTIDFNQGFSEVTRAMDMLNTDQYLQMRHEALRNDAVIPTPLNSPDLYVWDTTRYTNWQKELIGGKAHLTNAQIGLSGGNENTQFLFSGSFHRETTVFPTKFAYLKGSGHLNLNHHSNNKKFNMNVSVTYTADDNALPRQDLTGQAVMLQPLAPPLYDDNGALNWANGTWANPIASLLRKYQSNTKSLVSNLVLTYSITKDLIVKTNLGYTSIAFNEIATSPRASYNPFGNFFSSVSWGNNDLTTWIAEPQLEYQRVIGKGQLNILLGSTFQESNQTRESYSATGFPSDALLANVRSASTISSSGWSSTQYKYSAVFSRLNFNWDHKYIVNLTGRRDGSSRFGPQNRFANFGAVGAAWILSEEPFLKNQLGFVSFIKLRSSYGITGSDQVPDYGYLQTYSATSYPYQGSTGLYPTRLANANYSWESNKKFELALNIDFFKNRLRWSTSYFDNRSSNQLIGYALPATTGYSSVQANLPATVKNSGWEFDLTVNGISRTDFNWISTFNFTIPKNELLTFPNIELSSYANTYVVGKSLFLLKRIHYTGVDPQTGLYTFQDVDGNGSGTDRPADQQAIKKVTQNYFGGFRNTITYKNIELDFFFQFVSQTARNYLNSFTNPPGSRFSNQPITVMERWQQAGDQTDIEKFTTNAITPAGTSFRNLTSYSDKIVTDASFLRLKNVQLSYALPAQWANKLKIQNAQLFVQGQNLITITNYLGLDPENQSINALPPLRTISVGTHLTF